MKIAKICLSLITSLSILCSPILAENSVDQVPPEEDSNYTVKIDLADIQPEQSYTFADKDGTISIITIKVLPKRGREGGNIATGTQSLEIALTSSLLGIHFFSTSFYVNVNTLEDVTPSGNGNYLTTINSIDFFTYSADMGVDVKNFQSQITRKQETKTLSASCKVAFNASGFTMTRLYTQVITFKNRWMEVTTTQK